MPFELTPFVRVRRNAKGQVTQLLHVQQPYALDATANTVLPPLRYLADQYVREVLPLYELDADLATGLTSDSSSVPTNDGQQLRFASQKSLAGNATVAYVQTVRGVPVWCSGFSVQMVEDAQHVIGSQSTVLTHVAPKKPATNSAFLPDRITSDNLAHSLGILSPSAPLPRINQKRLFVYRYQEPQRVLPAPKDPKEGFVGDRPSMPLPPVAKDIPNGKDYFVTEVFFTWTSPKFGELNWQCLIEVETGSVLYLRPLVSCLNGRVFQVDPVSKTGNPANSPAAGAAVLDAFRDLVTLAGLAAPAAGAAQELTGQFVRVLNVPPPTAQPPTVMPPAAFDFTVDSDDFSAVNAYHHCDRLFRLVGNLGLPQATYFDGTTFPVRVDHRATIGGQANTVNAQAPGNSLGNGSDGFRFALAQVNTSIGIADDWRVVLHEFGHALLWDHVHTPNFGFSHSAGDSLAAILNDPGNQADRNATFPWIPLINRRHDRTAAGGWAWYGPRYEPFDPFGSDPAGYIAEQMLSSTMFRIYLSAGGGSSVLATQQFAANYVVFLILKAIGLLTPTTNAGSPEDFADVLIQADTGTFTHQGNAELCGVLQKVIRWGFEQQGAYQPPGTPPQTAMGPGNPPDVDVFIDDGRKGEYPYQATLTNAPDIWVRNAADGGTAHQVPLKNTSNSVYVRVTNRGTQPAANVRVTAFRSAVLGAPIWPTDWTSLTRAPLSAPNTLAPGAKIVVGPFPWVPAAAEELLLAFAEADGDACNAQQFNAAKPIDTMRLAFLDNNMAQRRLAIP